jgi:hypothetical protein
MAATQSEEAAEAMAHDGVVPEPLVTSVSHTFPERSTCTPVLRCRPSNP